MFTGLIEEIGSISSVKHFNSGCSITVQASKVLNNIEIGDSISINGACQTVVSFDSSTFTVDTVAETLNKTNFGEFQKGILVNLETSLTLSKKIGGHLVSGHIDTVGEICNIQALANSYIMSISFPKDYSKYIVHVGSIAIDGISLTIAENNDTILKVAVIPHTWASTILKTKKVGSKVNLEFDMLGKYVEKQLNPKSNSIGITFEKLKEMGF